MLLLPQTSDFQATYSSSQGRLIEQRRSSSQSLFKSFRKACRTSSRGRLFRLIRQNNICSTALVSDQSAVPEVVILGFRPSSLFA